MQLVPVSLMGIRACHVRCRAPYRDQPKNATSNIEPVRRNINSDASIQRSRTMPSGHASGPLRSPKLSTETCLANWSPTKTVGKRSLKPNHCQPTSHSQTVESISTRSPFVSRQSISRCSGKRASLPRICTVISPTSSISMTSRRFLLFK